MNPATRHGRMSASDRRQAILHSALSAFSRKGYGGTTTKEIAAAVGVTEAIIFRHFPSKQVLYSAVLDLRCQTPNLQDWLDLIHGHMASNDDAAVFRTLVGGVLKAHRDELEYERVLLFAALEGNVFGLAHNRQFSLPIVEELKEYLTRRQREGALRNFDPVLIMATLGGAAQYYAIQTQMFGFDAGSFSDEDVVEALTQIVLKGIHLTPDSKKRRKRL